MSRGVSTPPRRRLRMMRAAIRAFRHHGSMRRGFPQSLGTDEFMPLQRDHQATARESQPSLPLTQALRVRRRAVAEPAVELGRVLELLAAQTRHDDEPALDLGQSREVAPQLFELRNREDILLPVTP